MKGVVQREWRVVAVHTLGRARAEETTTGSVGGQVIDERAACCRARRSR